MSKYIILITVIFISLKVFGQQKIFDQKVKKIYVESDTIQIDTSSINPRNLKVYDRFNNLIGYDDYNVNSTKAQVYFKQTPYDTLIFHYQLFIIDLNKDYFTHDIKMNRNKIDDFYQPISVKIGV